MTVHETGSERPVVDVSGLPDHAFGHRGLIWWGTAGFMVIEGSMFVLALVAYFYLRLRVPEWPTRVPEPSLAPGVITTAILVLGCVPNYLTKAAAEQYQAGRARIGLIVCILFVAAAIVARAFEFPALNVSWQANAYGSVTWLVLGLHTSHLVTELLESLVLAAIVFSTEIDGPRFVDLSENSLYWYFVVGSWIPLYLATYFAPRWL